MFYTYIFGFTIPLKPGVLSVSPERVSAGETVELVINGYNTDWGSEEDRLQCYIRLDQDRVIASKTLNVIDRKIIRARFDIPSTSETNRSFVNGTLVVADNTHGYSLLPGGLTIVTSDSISTSGATWSDEINPLESQWVFKFPFVGILYETIRNTFFHVAIWFAMFILLIVSLVYAIRYLRIKDLEDDAISSSFAHVAIVFGIFGMITGSIWARHTWGAYWTNDPKLNMAAISVMIFIAYAILRKAMTSDDQRARISGAYNIFAFTAMIPLIFILPRLTSSLHPGNGGNPALGVDDLDNTLRLVFYPSIIGLTLLGFWIASLMYRVRVIELNIIDKPLSDEKSE